MTLTPGKMHRPTAIDRTGTSVFIVEQKNHRISKWKFTSGNFVFTLDAGQVDTLSLDAPGTGYSVTPILVFSAPDLDIANPVTATGDITAPAGTLQTPTLTDAGNGYSVAPTVTVVDSTGSGGAVSVSAIIDPWGSNGNGTSGIPGTATAVDDEFFNFPTGIAVNTPDNHLFVSDTRNNRVRVIDLGSGEFLGSVGTPGTGVGELYRPTHVSINAGDHIIAVADSRNHRFSTFNDDLFNFIDNAFPPTEGFYTPHGIKYNVNNGEFYYSDLIRSKLYSYGATGLIPADPTTIGTPGTDPTDPNQLFHPGAANGNTGISDHSYLTDTGNNKIKSFDNLGVISDVIVGAGTSEGKFYHPQDTIGFEQTAQYLLVCNTRNNRIEVFNRVNNEFQSTFGSPIPVTP